MKQFVQLFKSIDSTTKTTLKVNALVDYFKIANDADKLWAVAIFTHRRPPRIINTSVLRKLAAQSAQLPDWLFEETYHIVGDLAETISLVIPNNTSTLSKSLTEILTDFIQLKPKAEEEKTAYILSMWDRMNADERFIFNKLITGGFRVGVSQKTMVKAIAQLLEEDENIIAHRIMGKWSPVEDTWQNLIVSPSEGEDHSKPYPFYLAYPLEDQIEDLGKPLDWTAEWKWDGIRGQLIKRNSQLSVWSRGEELVTEKYPEFQHLIDFEAHDFVIDGEIIPMKEGRPLPFNLLQKRIGRKNISKKLLAEIPIHLIAYDLLEIDGTDIRNLPLVVRRERLENLINKIEIKDNIILSHSLTFSNWDQLADMRTHSREKLTEGLMLKRKNSSYKVGRKKGDWWKWKVDPLEIDAVMLYAQRGHGRRANLYTDFTFAVWDQEKLVPFTKAYSGLTDEEFKEISTWVKKNTIERFGPVASVSPELVFTIAFEGIAKSNRHKSGVALRFPRMKRWRKDKRAIEADHLQSLTNLIQHP